MAKNLNEAVFKNFSTGLNVVDSTIDMSDSDLVVADNVLFTPTGEVESIDGLLKQGNPIYVNGTIATSLLGAPKRGFNGSVYLMASNGSEARLMKRQTVSKSITVFADAGSGQVTVTATAHGFQNGYSITILGTTNYNGTFTIANVATDTFEITATFSGDDATGSAASDQFLQVSATNFNASNKVEFVVYNDLLYFVNGAATGTVILNTMTTSDVLGGLTTASGLEAGINNIALHLERLWITKENKIFVSRQFPTGSNNDWNNTRAYEGSSVAGLIQLDDNSDDEILGVLELYGQLVVFREFTIHVVSGKVIVSQTIQKAFNSRGVLAPQSIAKADKNVFFVAREGVKIFSGVTVQEGTTQFDTITTESLDRKIRTLITGVSDQTKFVGYAFKDKYYLSDPRSNVTFVFDEITGGWSRWLVGGCEVFVEDGQYLYCGKASQYYRLNADTSASITSTIKTKDYNLGTDVFYKLFEKLIATFRTKTETSIFNLMWYIDGATEASGTKEITVRSADITWDDVFSWDQEGLRWDTGIINFTQQKQRKLKSGITIAFGIEATVLNRFSLNALDLLFEQKKKEV